MLLERAARLLSHAHAVGDESPHVRDELAPLFTAALVALGDAQWRAWSGAFHVRDALRHAREAERAANALERAVEIAARAREAS
ncbi:hypothetical protein DB32_005814 [Sandaracinus amylolyticus]|uniref:Uncharacterized protein n=1 Tax=Sandaracinus amylolyticus TaxID=927083 RepID=A0A0F6W6Q4_9BACT|nr:hypothetical protein DB32_005814 [Sandaracinus amylolyticus]